MNTTDDTQHNAAIDQHIEKFLNALLIVFHELGVTPEEGQELMTNSQIEVDDEGFMRYVLPNYFLYTLSEEQIKQGGFGEATNEVVIPIAGDRYFVVVEC